MKEFIEKLIGRLEALRNDKYVNGVDRFTTREKRVFDIAEEIVNQLAEEYNKKDFYEITLNGCDDDTCFVMEITENEHEFLLKVSEKANETSTYGCMPRLYVEKVTIKGE